MKTESLEDLKSELVFLINSCRGNYFGILTEMDNFERPEIEKLIKSFEKKLNIKE